MFTSRSEHRLALRHDNADERLEPKGRELGLVGDTEWERFNQRRARLAQARGLLVTQKIRRADTEYAELRRLTGQDLGDSITLGQLALRPHVGPDQIMELLPGGSRSGIQVRDIQTALADCLYAGYLQTQDQTAKRLYQHDAMSIPASLSFKTVPSLSHEMVERLERVRPVNFGQARIIPGVTPAALSNLLVYLSSYR